MSGMGSDYVIFALLGLVFGSFGNVLMLRIRKAETLGGRSHCTHCRTTIAWFDLLPLLSFLLLRGRCRHCEKSISIQYPLVEAASMGIFLLGFSFTPLDPVHALVTSFALYFLFLACVYDGMYQQIPDLFTELFACAVIIDFGIGLTRGEPVLTHLIGTGVLFGWFGFQWAVSRGKAVGTGDIFLGSAIGFWLGFPHALVMLVLSYMVGAVVVGILLATNTISMKRERIAFGPFMGTATLLTLLGAGDAYLSLLH